MAAAEEEAKGEVEEMGEAAAVMEALCINPRVPNVSRTSGVIRHCRVPRWLTNASGDGATRGWVVQVSHVVGEGVAAAAEDSAAATEAAAATAGLAVEREAEAALAEEAVEREAEAGRAAAAAAKEAEAAGTVVVLFC